MEHSLVDKYIVPSYLTSDEARVKAFDMTGNIAFVHSLSSDSLKLKWKPL